MTSTSERKRTSLWASHNELGARLIDFGGWDMPVQYKAGTIKEHTTVRQSVGLFDVSHMGEAYLRGPRARQAVDKITTNAVGAAPIGKAVYTLLCRPDGGIVDDCIFYKRSETEFFVIVNASNQAKDLEWMREQVGDICEIEDVSDQLSLIAVQGPRAVEMVNALTNATSNGGNLSSLPVFGFTDAAVAGVRCIAARTGYTGEDGFELACSNEDAPKLWAALLDAATPLGGLPIGLAARDTLRLEAKLPLYGNDIDDTTSPLEAGLGWAVKLDKGEFLGRDALLKQKAAGLTRQLVGFRVADDVRAIARHGYNVVDGDKVLGTVTSGGPGITVGGAIGLAYVPIALAATGTTIQLDCRGKHVAANVVAGKFYKRPPAAQ